jgi:hypothetical protein
MTDTAKIFGAALIAALITSVVTVWVTEPLRLRLHRRRIRKWLYGEMMYNCGRLSAWVHSAKANPETQQHTSAQFAGEYRRLAYELAVKDAGFYSLRREELYYIDNLYRDFDRIANGGFTDSADCFLRAGIAASAVLHGVQDRALRRGVVFSVSSRLEKQYLRNNVPHRFFYLNYDDAPRWKEKLREYWDRLVFWSWSKRK